VGKDDEIVAAFKVYAEDTICALTHKGRLLCCEAGEVNLLSGAGKGVILVKPDANDYVEGAFMASTPIKIHKTSGGVQKLTGAEREPTSRGGKGRPVFKRGAVKTLELPLPEMPVLDEDE